MVSVFVRYPSSSRLSDLLTMRNHPIFVQSYKTTGSLLLQAASKKPIKVFCVVLEVIEDREAKKERGENGENAEKQAHVDSGESRELMGQKEIQGPMVCPE